MVALLRTSAGETSKMADVKKCGNMEIFKTKKANGKTLNKQSAKHLKIKICKPIKTIKNLKKQRKSEHLIFSQPFLTELSSLEQVICVVKAHLDMAFGGLP